VRGRAAAALAAVLAIALIHGAVSHAQAPRDLLPDLEVATPDHVVLTVHHDRAFVGFNSKIVNRGEGPLEIAGTRSSRRSTALRARQLVTRSDGTKAAVRDVGSLRFVHEPRHRYWHLDDVMRYELRTVSTFSLVREGSRRGYCLRDGATFPHFCGRELPGLLSLTEGIGPANGSRWAPEAEGQSFDVTRLASGRYWLVQRADPDGRFLESDITNNVSSVLVHFTSLTLGRTRRVRLTLLGACPGAERCANPESFAE
jgi:hypothetical protein